MSWDDADFMSGDPLVRFNAHQAAKGRTQIGDPDLARKRARENGDPNDLTVFRGMAPKPAVRGGIGRKKPVANKRTAASAERIADIREKKLADGCRLCGKHPASAHHIIPRSQGGIWTESNIVGLCGSGTTGCHGLVEARDKPACYLLRATLTDAEYAYVVGKQGEGWLDRRYPVGDTT